VSSKVLSMPRNGSMKLHITFSKQLLCIYTHSYGEANAVVKSSNTLVRPSFSPYPWESETENGIGMVAVKFYYCVIESEIFLVCHRLVRPPNNYISESVKGNWKYFSHFRHRFRLPFIKTYFVDVTISINWIFNCFNFIATSYIRFWLGLLYLLVSQQYSGARYSEGFKNVRFSTCDVCLSYDFPLSFFSLFQLFLTIHHPCTISHFTFCAPITKVQTSNTHRNMTILEPIHVCMEFDIW